MAKKTFKIGEYAKGGIIVAELNKKNQEIRLECLDYQTRELLFTEQSDDRCYLMQVLNDWTSSYYADKIMDWLGESGFKEANLLWS